ncbi:MAG: 30S ribosomal protein S16 [Mollicutes bacterium]|nr:30S ribosomal protein S16 [Mollicutes bacterium]
MKTLDRRSDAIYNSICPLRRIISMVKIRLARQGRVHTPSYRIVVSDSRRTPSSAALDQLGSYDSVSGAFTLDEEKALYWLNQGAIASDSVRTLLTKKGIYKKYTDAKIAAKKAAKSEAK